MPLRIGRIVVAISILLPIGFSAVRADEAATQPTTAPTTRHARGMLGVIVQDANDQKDGGGLAKAMGGNLIVNGVRPHSRAERIGLKVGDVILKIDGHEMQTVPDIIRAVGAGDLLEIEVMRDHQVVPFKEPADVP